MRSIKSNIDTDYTMVIQFTDNATGRTVEKVISYSEKLNEFDINNDEDEERVIFASKKLYLETIKKFKETYGGND